MKLISRNLCGRILCGIAVSACLLLAQGDPPGRVAHLSYVYGAASYRPGDLDEWAPVDPNRPFTTGDHFFVEVGGTAELQFGSGALRMNQATSLEFLNLDDSNVQLRLSEGSLIIRLRYLGDQDNVEVDTPNLAFSLLRTGDYRIDVKPDLSATIVTVRGGEGELTGPDQAFTVRPGEQVSVTGNDQPSYQTAGVPAFDYLDNWSAGRDHREDRLPAARYVSTQMVGYQDLDQYGSWRTTPEYGAVWVPNNTPGDWAPYHNGHWLWVDPWGWTWVDDLPWGFAPFHYGRWAYVGNSWGWIPGPIADRPVYAPALVAWVGGGSIGDAVAWFPLGPHEVFVPTYHVSPGYLTRVNVTNTVIVNNINITNINVTNVRYVNREAPHAVMAVQRTAFVSARPVQSAAIVVRPEQIRSVNVVASVAIAPTRTSVVRVATPGARVVQPPAAVQARQVVAKRTPPPAPVPFAQKQQVLAANGGRPLDAAQVQQIRQKQPAPAQPLVRQVQARAPSPAAQAPAGQVNRPSQAAPQRTPAPFPAQTQPVKPAPNNEVQPVRPAPQTPQPGRPVPPAQVRPVQPNEAQPGRPTPPPQVRPVQPNEPQPGRPTPPPQVRPVQPNEPQPARPTPPAAQPSRPAPPREVQRPAPPENRAAPPQAKPAPKKENTDRKKDNDEKNKQ